MIREKRYFYLHDLVSEFPPGRGRKRDPSGETNVAKVEAGTAAATESVVNASQINSAQKQKDDNTNK